MSTTIVLNNKIYKEEGITHINLTPYSNSKAGRISSIQWRKTFFIPHLGEFLSPAAFCSWFVTKNESERLNPNPKLNQRLISTNYNLILYSKVCQFYRLKRELNLEEKDIQLPWFFYRQHKTGIRELVNAKLPIDIKQAVILIRKGEDFSKVLTELGLNQEKIHETVKRRFEMTEE